MTVLSNLIATNSHFLTESTGHREQDNQNAGGSADIQTVTDTVARTIDARETPTIYLGRIENIDQIRAEDEAFLIEFKDGNAIRVVGLDDVVYADDLAFLEFSDGTKIARDIVAEILGEETNGSVTGSDLASAAEAVAPSSGVNKFSGDQGAAITGLIAEDPIGPTPFPVALREFNERIVGLESDGGIAPGFDGDRLGGLISDTDSETPAQPNAPGPVAVVLTPAAPAPTEPTEPTAEPAPEPAGPKLRASAVSLDESDGLGAVAGQISYDGGDLDYDSFTLSASGATWDAETKTLTEDNGVWQIELQPDGSYVFTQLLVGMHEDADDHDDHNRWRVTVEGETVDGEPVQTKFLAEVLDDGPSIDSSLNPMIVVDEDDLPELYSYSGPEQPGDDDQSLSLSGTLDFDPGADGAGGLYLTDSGAPNGFDYTLAGDVLTVTQNGTTVLEVELTDPVTGAFDVRLINPVAHDGNDPGYENDVDFTFTYGVEDGDGDTAFGTFGVKVDDDMPVFRFAEIDNPTFDETDGLASGDTVWEADLGNAFVFKAGADGMADYELVAPGAVWDSEAMTLTHEDYVLTVEKMDVFSKDAFAFYSYINQINPIDHADSDDPNDVHDLSIVLKVTDGDGDVWTKDLGVTIVDDGPTAGESEGDGIALSQVGGLKTVQTIEVFDYGTDGMGSLVLSADGATWDDATNTLIDDNGVWQITEVDILESDGSTSHTYEVTQLQPIDPNTDLNVEITWTLTDGDGDTTTQVETLVIEGGGDQVVVGTDGDDLLTDNGTANTFYGLGGNDTIIGGGEADTIFGGDGDDYIEGAAGNDVIDPGDGADTIYINGDASGDEDVINFFDVIDDSVDLSGLLDNIGGSESDVEVTQDGDDVVISVGPAEYNVTLDDVLVGVDPGDINNLLGDINLIMNDPGGHPGGF